MTVPAEVLTVLVCLPPNCEHVSGTKHILISFISVPIWEMVGEWMFRRLNLYRHGGVPCLATRLQMAEESYTTYPVTSGGTASGTCRW